MVTMATQDCKSTLRHIFFSVYLMSNQDRLLEPNHCYHGNTLHICTLMVFLLFRVRQINLLNILYFDNSPRNSCRNRSDTMVTRISTVTKFLLSGIPIGTTVSPWQQIFSLGNRLRSCFLLCFRIHSNPLKFTSR